MGAVAKFTFFSYLFWFLIGSLMTRFEDQRVIGTGRSHGQCFKVSSAAYLALMALERVRSDSLRGLSRNTLSFVPQTIISLIRESQRFSNSHSALNFFSLVMKSWKLWPSSCQIRDKFMAENSAIFPFVAIHRELIQYRF